MRVSMYIISVFPRLIRRILIKILKMVGCDVVMRLGEFDFQVPLWGQGALTSLNWEKTWSVDLYTKLLQINDGIFIDIGANVGQSLMDILYINKKLRYIGFEPNPSCSSYIDELIRVNNLDDHSVLTTAIGEQYSILTLYLEMYSNTDTSATLISNLRPGREYAKKYVTCINFDIILNCIKIDNVSIVKIDVEGAELEVLHGIGNILTKFRPIVAIEVLFSAKNSDLSLMAERNKNVLNIANDNGYEIYQIVKSKDLKFVLYVMKIDAFKSEYYNDENKELCDYLMVPLELKNKLVTTFDVK